MAMRAAWRYSSIRCADGTAVATTSVAIEHAAAALPGRDFRTVVVGGVAVDRVDVIDVPLRRVLDDQRRSLNAEVRRAAIGRGPAPREVRLRQVGPDLGHAW